MVPTDLLLLLFLKSVLEVFLFMMVDYRGNYVSEKGFFHPWNNSYVQCQVQETVGSGQK